VKIRRLMWRSLRHYFWQNLGIGLALSLATAVAVAAFLVGHSFDRSLRELANLRVGQVALGVRSARGAMTPGLAKRVARQLDAPVAPILLADAGVSTPDDRALVGTALMVGIDREFAAVTGWGALTPPGAGEALVNRELAVSLGVGVGDTIVVRTAGDGLPGGGPLSRPTLRVDPQLVRITRVLDAAQGGAFGLGTEHKTRPLVYLNLAAMASGQAQPRADWLLIGAADPARVEAVVKDALTPADLGLRVERLASGEWQVTSPSIYLPDEVLATVTAEGIEPLQVLTYLATAIEVGEKSIPYALVSGLSGPVAQYPELARLAAGEVLLNQWAAEQLGAARGDVVVLRYQEPRRGGGLESLEARFTSGGAVAMSGLGADPQLMPYVEGISNADSCRDWEVGIDVDLSLIRPEDEAYWNQYKGAPKALVPMSTAKRLWGNRRATLTGMRLPETLSEAEVSDLLSTRLPDKSKGVSVVPLAGRAQDAVDGAMDFGAMVLGFGGILGVCALLLAAMAISLALRARSHETGLLVAVGWPPGAIGRLVLGQVLWLALWSALPGVLLGCGLTVLLMWHLAGNWGSGPTQELLSFHWTWSGVLLGALGGVLVSAVTASVVAMRQQRGVVHALLKRAPRPHLPGRWGPLVTGGLALVLAAGALALALVARRGLLPAEVGLFVGGLMLVGAFLAALWTLLAGDPLGREAGVLSRRRMLVRTLTWQPGRVLASCAILSLGIYLVVAASAYRLSVPATDARASGTGGFDLVATTAHPLLPAASGTPGALPTVAEPGLVVPISVHDGDEASCRNLARPQEPRVLGVPAAQLAQLGAFTIARTWQERPHSWEVLTESPGNGELAGAADMATISWSFQARLGDLIEMTDGYGRPVKIRLVAALENSLWQGALLVDSRSFAWNFRRDPGARMFLIDAPADNLGGLADELARTYWDYGWQAEDAAAYLGSFLTVQNRYLAAFQLMGGLALVLGALGFGVLVLRSGLERRRELALLEALGESRRRLALTLGTEQLAVLVLGLLCGLLPACAVVVPMVARGAGLTGALMGLAVFCGALLAGALATFVASLRTTGNTLRHVLVKEE
jgi:putative ABC transport system permease protein